MFGFRTKERLSIAEDVLKQHRLTNEIYQRRKKLHLHERIFATIIFTAICLFVIFIILPRL